MATSAAMKEKYYRRQALYWLVLAAAILAAWAILWLASSTPAITKKDEANKEVAQAAELPTHIESLNELHDVVPPIDFSTLIRDLRTYPAEFKDKNYFNAKKFTVQVMDVAQNDVIVNYLNTRDDRDKFAYFRYLDANQNPRYILTYGKFDSLERANAALQSTSFDLPASVSTSAVSMGDYLNIIDDYERGDAVRDLSSRQPRQVRLQATRTEIPVQAATEADEALANRSREQAREREAQMQSGDAAIDAAAGNESEPRPANDTPKETKPKEVETPPQQASDAAPAVSAPATPNVNTSQVPGSDNQ